MGSQSLRISDYRKRLDANTSNTSSRPKNAGLYPHRRQRSSYLGVLPKSPRLNGVNKFVYLHPSSIWLPPPSSDQGNTIDAADAKFLSDLASRSQLSLPAFVRLMRGQTPTDGRPNKVLDEVPVPSNSSRQSLYRQWNEIVREGVRPKWTNKGAQVQLIRPPNHKSGITNPQSVRRHIRKGQREGRYLVLNESVLQLWPKLVVSPAGVIEKAGDDTRMISDYSYPRGSSVNEITDRANFPPISYNPPRDIARRIHELRIQYPDEEVLIMLGDVSGAFRHVPVHENAVYRFTFVYDGSVVIDLSCGFGWCGSPAFYSMTGSVIYDLYESTTLTEASGPELGHLQGNLWSEDHTCVEANRGQRCQTANSALRLAMATVLGPTAINDRKFRTWGTQNKALGLLWNTADGTVSIPNDKLDKASRRLNELVARGRATRTELNKLLGIMRYVTTCFPPARSFYQRVHVAAITAPLFGSRKMESEVIEDLRWFTSVIDYKDHFNRIPVGELAGATTPSVHVYMDAFGSGLCVLEPQRKEYIRVQYSELGLQPIQSGTFENSINVRELHSAGRNSTSLGVTMAARATNTSGARSLPHRQHKCSSMGNSRLSRHPTAQLYNRLLSFAEFKYHLALSAEHIAGKLNIMADAGSRARSDTHPLWKSWSNLSLSWTQVEVLPRYDNLYSVWERLCAVKLWQEPHKESTTAGGNNGNTSPS